METKESRETKNKRRDSFFVSMIGTRAASSIRADFSAMGMDPLTTLLVYLDKRFNGTNISSEFFNTAGRTVKTGLTAAVIVSQWTWAATLLQSSNVA